MIDLLVEVFGSGVVGEAQDLSAADAGDTSGACNEQDDAVTSGPSWDAEPWC
jgi:hypothetical protein